jgi:ribosome-binding factor A
VRDALSGALGGLEDEVLVDAWIIEVIPAPDASHLRVIVAASPDADLDAVHEALGRASGVLRGEVASAITRKRTPLLSFQVVREAEP